MRWIAVATVFWGSMMGAAIVVADDVDDVKAAYLQHIANTHSGNVDGFVGQHPAEHSAFGPTGALLTRYDSIEDQKKLVRAALDAGRAGNPGRSSVRAFSDVQVPHLEAGVYGRLSAVRPSAAAIISGVTSPSLPALTFAPAWIKVPTTSLPRITASSKAVRLSSSLKLTSAPASSRSWTVPV